MDRHFHPDTKIHTSGYQQKLSERPIFQLIGVNVAIERNIILHQIQLIINKGDFIFITGPTGAGKTTLLRFLYGELFNYSGEYIHSLQTPKGDYFISRIFQDLKLFNELTVSANLELAFDAHLYDDQNQFWQDLKEYAKILGVLEHLDKKVENLSGGLKQKVAIMRTLLSKPDILLADEPTSNLDKKSSIQFFDILNFLNVKRKMTVLWATHNHDLIKNFHGKLIHLERGKITYVGNACIT